MSQISDTRKIYLAQIHQLKTLQMVDDEIHKINKTLEKGPQELEKLEASFKAVDDRRSHILEKLEHLQKQQKELERTTADEAERLKKSKEKLMAAGNEREYNAATSEIDSIEKMSQPRDDERLALQDELNTQNTMLEETDKEYQNLKAQVEQKRADVEKTQNDAAKSLKKLNKTREENTQNISRPILQRYEFIRERLEHPVIVALKDAICPSCHIAVPPQTYNDLLRGGQIMSCPNCQRLIVSFEDFIEDDEAAKQKAAEEREQEKDQAAAGKPVHRGRSAALESREYSKDDPDEVGFGPGTEEQLDDDLHMGNTIENDLDVYSRSADISDLTGMSETAGLDGLGGLGTDEADKSSDDDLPGSSDDGHMRSPHK